MKISKPKIKKLVGCAVLFIIVGGLLHELGHFLIARYLGLNPVFLFGPETLLGFFAIGIPKSANASSWQLFLVGLGGLLGLAVVPLFYRFYGQLVGESTFLALGSYCIGEIISLPIRLVNKFVATQIACLPMLLVVIYVWRNTRSKSIVRQ